MAEPLDLEALKRDFAQALADLSAYWGREKNYSWTITLGQQADIVALIQPLVAALERISELERERDGWQEIALQVQDGAKFWQERAERVEAVAWEVIACVDLEANGTSAVGTRELNDLRAELGGDAVPKEYVTARERAERVAAAAQRAYEFLAQEGYEYESSLLTELRAALAPAPGKEGRL